MIAVVTAPVRTVWTIMFYYRFY